MASFEVEISGVWGCVSGDGTTYEEAREECSKRGHHKRKTLVIQSAEMEK